MPVLMILAEWRYLRRGEQLYRELAQRWARGTAILFAVGAVSGTVLSFELGILWPGFMAEAGPLIGMPFSLEGFAFFLEAIALGIYLYGWDRVSPWVHWASGFVVALSGLLSGIFVTAVNAWMNTPRGVMLGDDGHLHSTSLWEAFFTPAFPTQAFHMVIAAFSSVSLAVYGLHAYQLYKKRQPEFQKAAMNVALPCLLISSMLQIFSGDLSAKHIAEYQPAKLAAAEGLFETEIGAPLLIGGIPLVDEEKTILAIEIPKMLSVMAFGDPDASVRGLSSFPKNERPPIVIVHLAFQVMVGIGSWMIILAAYSAYRRFRYQDFGPPWLLILAALSTPLGMIALESGWIVTEVGRQPWIVHGLMRTADAVTPAGNLTMSLTVAILVYGFLGIVVAQMLRRYVRNANQELPTSTKENRGLL